MLFARGASLFWPASASIQGGVKGGNGFGVDGEGWGLGSGGLVVLFARGASLLWSASVGVKGGVKGGNGFGVDGEGGS